MGTQTAPRLTECAFGHPAGMRFRFGQGGREQVLCFRHALLYPPLVRTAALTAIVVGTVLTTINQGNLIASGDVPAALYWKVPLTYCVPYTVATWSAMRLAHLRA